MPHTSSENHLLWAKQLIDLAILAEVKLDQEVPSRTFLAEMHAFP